MTVKLQPYLGHTTFRKLADDIRNDIPTGKPSAREVRRCANDQDTVMRHNVPQFASVTARRNACDALKAQRCVRQTAISASFIGSTMAHAMAIARFLRTGSNMSSAEQGAAAHLMAQDIFTKARAVCEPAERTPAEPAANDAPTLGAMLGEVLEIFANTVIGLATDPQYNEWTGELITCKQ